MTELCVEHLSFAYREKNVLSEISFTLRGGEMLAVLGPNGVGKSTLFRCILGMLPGYSGQILLGGREIRRLSRAEMGKRIAYIPQIHRPTFGYTVLDTVLMGTTRQLSAFGQPGKAQIRVAMDALERVGAAHLAERDYAKLSGGEQQLALIARAIAQQAEILVMDEPTASLDYGNQFRVLKLAQSLAGAGYAVLLSTHNPQHALSFSSSVLALRDGSVEAFGEPKTVLNRELIAKLYGVDVCFVDTPAGPMLVPLENGGITP